ncbi:MAG: hypothetical protein ACJA1B_001791 [Polaribacter sp.]|jgi:hypothetical protein
METKKYLIVLIALFFYVSTNSQETESIEFLYSSYFENTREIPYLHLNKTTFLEGEEIWFQAYILEQNSKKPHPTTSNLYVSIFNDKGELKDQQLIHITEGKGAGSIYLDSTYTKETYYLKASTNWMKNFKEDNSYTQEIKLLSNKRKTIIKTNTEDAFFDFQVLPESGYFLEDIINTAGVLIKDKNGKGQKIIKGILKEIDSDRVIGDFSTNNFGLGKFSFLHQKNRRYILEATLDNGSVINEILPIAEKKGITMQVDNQNTKFLEITLIANKETFTGLKNLDFKIWIHNTNTYYKNTISINKDELAKTLFIKNSKLSKGVNIITVFDQDNNPLLERLIYNHTADLFFEPKITSKTISQDSISTTISNPTNKKIYVSASFLPTNTNAYKPDNNIISNFLLKPFIKGSIQNAAYYFENINRRKLNDLDLLLLTQGWSKYSWSNIFNKPPTINFDFENGIDVKVNLNKRLGKKEKILIYSVENNLIREILPNQKTDTIKNSFITKNSEIQFSLKNNIRYLEVVPILSFSNGKILETINLDTLKNRDVIFKQKEVLSSDYTKLINGTEVLNEIIIIGEKKYKNETRGKATAFKKLNFKNMAFNQNSLVDFITPIYARYIRTLSPLNTFYLNNENITGKLYALIDIEMEEVREIRLGTCIIGRCREMHIYTYSLKEFSKVQVKSTKIKLDVGFQKNKEYYQPKYSLIIKETYEKYGAIYWKSNITIKPNSTTEIRIPKKYQDKIRVFIEGISESGKMISNENVIGLD